MVYCVSYDLRAPGRNYLSLFEAIKSSGYWWHQTESVWFVISKKSAVEIRDTLMKLMDENDKLFICALQKEWAGRGFSEEEYNWLKSIPEDNWR